jgi:hypothetical protein
MSSEALRTIALAYKDISVKQYKKLMESYNLSGNENGGSGCDREGEGEESPKREGEGIEEEKVIGGGNGVEEKKNVKRREEE